MLPRLDEKHLAWTLHRYLIAGEADLTEFLENAGYPRALGSLLEAVIQDETDLHPWIENVFNIFASYDLDTGIWIVEGKEYDQTEVDEAIHNLIKERYEASRLIEP